MTRAIEWIPGRDVQYIEGEILKADISALFENIDMDTELLNGLQDCCLPKLKRNRVLPLLFAGIFHTSEPLIHLI